MPTLRESVLQHDHRALCPELDEKLAVEYGLGANPSFDDTKVQKLWERCRDDPELYLFGGFVRTFDERDYENRIKPFPDKPYHRRVLRFIHFDNNGTAAPDGDVVAISKSRQMQLTWLACAYATHQARFFSHSRVMVQSKKAEDAWKLVYKSNWNHGRAAFVERAMPPWFFSLGLRGTRGELTYENGSEIWGVPQGGAMFRSFTATLAICDEACFQPEFEDAYTSALPMARRILLISTALAGTYYAKLVEEDDSEEEAA